jgi:hypothetical protein
MIKSLLKQSFTASCGDDGLLIGRDGSSIGTWQAAIAMRAGM